MLKGWIAIITDEPGWHGRQLSRAFAKHGLEGVYVSLKDCRLDLHTGTVSFPVEHHELPAGVFVRGVPGGTLEQVIVRLDILHALREIGVFVYNDVRAIERTVDKAMTTFLLRRSGIPSPHTWVTESEQEARAIVIREIGMGRSLVMKPLFGSQGIGVTLIQSPDELPDVANYGAIYYLQSFIDRTTERWQDWRVFVIGGQAQAAMLRSNDHWVTNRAQGAQCSAAELEPSLVKMAEDAVRAVNIDYAGVDLMQDVHGKWYVIEVNSIPAWQGLQTVCEFSITERIVNHFLNRLLAQELDVSA